MMKIFAIAIFLQSKNDVDGALNKYKLIDAESQKGAEIWNNVGLCFYKKKKFIAVFIQHYQSYRWNPCSTLMIFIYLSKSYAHIHAQSHRQFPV